jgi:hypothetical protein
MVCPVPLLVSEASKCSRQPYILGLSPLLLGQKLVGHGKLAHVSHPSYDAHILSEVPGKLGAGGRHGRRLPGVGDASERSARRRSPRGASHRPCSPHAVSPSIRTLRYLHSSMHRSSASSSGIGGAVPQTELPVAGGVAVPVGERLHPALQPRALHDVGGERRGRHGGGVFDGGSGVSRFGAAVNYSFDS